MSIEHPLAQYATVPMLSAWAPEWQVVEERELWLRVLRFHAEHGVYDHVADLDRKIKAYQQVKHNVNWPRILERERVTRHDVKARIEEFNHLAGQSYAVARGKDAAYLELIHAGMTSADIVDNISLIRFLKLIRWLRSLAVRDAHLDALDSLRHRLPFRGIKGAIGTQQDQLDLLGDRILVDQLDCRLADLYGFKQVLGSVGQVYPRSIDLDVASTLLVASPSTQPWRTVANGYAAMIAAYSGDQWNEGDVSTSVVRRVALPGIFIATEAAIRGVEP